VAVSEVHEGGEPEVARVPVISTRGITKHFGSVQALRGVDLDVYEGEVVGLVGDNGAGKSTLVNILSGALQANDGSIFVDGKEVTFTSSLEARRAGIETVYQDLSLAPDLSVWANIFLGREQSVKGPLRWFHWLDRKAMAKAQKPTWSARTSASVPSTRSPGGSPEANARP